MKIILSRDKAYSWIQKNNIFTKGYAFVNNTMYIGNDLNNLFRNINDETELTEIVKKLNGHFSVIIKTPDAILAAVDITRSIPLFFSIKYECITDNPATIKNEFKLTSFETNCVHEFFSTGYVTGYDTILNDVDQVLGGEVIALQNHTIKRCRYFEYNHTDDMDKGDTFYKNKFMQVLEHTFSRLKQLTENKHIVIPLSSGYDSRLIAIMCKKFNIENISCYTYGPKNHPDVLGAKHVAEKLKLPIHIVDRIFELNKFYNSDILTNFYKYAFDYVSIPYIQDLQALDYLVKHKMIPQDSILTPGHCGDFISGRHLERIFSENDILPVEEVVNEIYRRQYSIYRPMKKDTNFFKMKIKNQLLSDPKAESGTLYENWIWTERMAKFLTNSVRAYEFFDLKWALPLWDKELVEFFLHLPKKYRVYQNFYKTFIQKAAPEINIKKKPKTKIAWLFNYRFRRYKLIDYLNMFILDFYFKDYRKPNPRILHKLTLVRFKYLLK